MKQRNRFVIMLILMMSAVIITSCNSTSNNGEKTSSNNKPDETENTGDNDTEGSFPVTVENVERALTFEAAPKRTVALLQQDAELMLALGLEEELVGYSLVSEGTPAEYEEKLAAIPVLAENIPSKEVILETDPDFVIGTEVDFSENGVGTIDELANLGITSYMTKFESPETVENQVYKEIEDLALIFGVEERGKELIQSMQKEMDTIIEKVGKVDEPLKVFYMNGGEAGSAETTGGDSLQSSLIEQAGGENIFSDLKGYRVEVSWEEVIERDPDIIVLSYCCGTGPDTQKDIITSNSALEDIKAVQNERYVAVEVEDLVGTVRIPRGLETLTKGFYPERFE